MRWARIDDTLMLSHWRIDDRIMQGVATNGALQSLTAAELRLDVQPLSIDPRPRRKVRAWVRFGDSPIRVDAIASRRTPDAVGVRFSVEGTDYRCWVWIGAIEEISAAPSS